MPPGITDYGMLINSSNIPDPEDEGKLRVTYHHNWWAQNVDQRMPRVMYGEGHIYNNFYNSPGNSVCVGFGSYGSVLLQNNYFKDVKNPHQFMYDVYAYAEASGNTYDNVSGAKDTGKKGSRDAAGNEGATANPVKPPYSFSLDAASAVPDLVKRCAGPRAASSSGGGDTGSGGGGNSGGGGSGICAAMWGQCGGLEWTGTKCCAQGTCQKVNDYYHQCAVNSSEEMAVQPPQW